MKATLSVLALCAIAASAQTLDFSSLDKLAAKAKESNVVSLDENQLRAALQMMPQSARKDKDKDFQKLASSLHSVNIRNFEFDRPGEYTEADLAAVRRQFASLHNCSKIIDSKEKNEHSEIYMCRTGDTPDGIGIISAEQKELTVLFVRGTIAMGDLGKLNGFMGMPSVQPVPPVPPQPPEPKRPE